MKPPSNGPRRIRLSLILPLLLIILLAVVLVRTGWVCDDAYITLRSVDNFVQGLGLRWNPAERVQSYTHPLWMFLLAAIYYFTRAPYFTALILGMILSLVTAVLVAFRVGRSTGGVVLALLILILSKAFTDYSTSGLENPLSHLLLVLLMLVYLRESTDLRRLFQISLLTALIALNRLDLLLMAGPFMLATWKETGWVKGWRPVLIGLLPIILWEIFSLVYYGLPFPNTAYAKLDTGLSQGEMIRQSGWYFWQSLKIDPLTLTTVLAGIILALTRRSKGDWPVAIGTLLYLLYVVKIGGDFMGGRFFVAPLLIAVLLIARVDFTPPKLRRLVPLFALLVVVLGFSSLENPLLSGSSYGSVISSSQNFLNNGGVADERAYYYQAAGLLNYRSGIAWPDHRYTRSGIEFSRSDKKIVFTSNVGYLGYFAGPHIYLYDPLALSDPLLSHLPVVRYRWRIGHGFRMAPDGHIESAALDTNVIVDSSLHAYYDVIRTLTRKPIFSFKRFREIIAFNLGAYDHLIHEYLTRPPERLPFADIKLLPEEGRARPSQAKRLGREGVMIIPQTRLFGRWISMLLDIEDDYQVIAYRNNEIIADDTARALEVNAKGREWRIDMSKGTRDLGCDSLFVRPMAGNGRYWVGDVQVLP